jgi:hypothetical protein
MVLSRRSCRTQPLEPLTETVRKLIDESANLHRELRHLKKPLELTQQADYAPWQEEKELLPAQLEQ